MDLESCKVSALFSIYRIFGFFNTNFILPDNRTEAGIAKIFTIIVIIQWALGVFF